MANPYRSPRPNSIDPECLGEGAVSWEDLFHARNLRDLLQDNFEWLCHEVRNTREIYRALFGRVDPMATRSREGMTYLNEALWDLGFRTIGESPHPLHPSWKWVQVA